MGHYSFNRPQRDGRLSWPCWLTDSGRFTHKVVKRPSISLVQERESSPARTDVLTTMLHHQPLKLLVFVTADQSLSVVQSHICSSSSLDAVPGPSVGDHVAQCFSQSTCLNNGILTSCRIQIIQPLLQASEIACSCTWPFLVELLQLTR